MKHWLLAVMVLTLAGPAQSSPKVGDSYAITRDRQSTQRGSDGSSGSTSDRDTIIERVIGVSDAGVELEYDLPKGATKEDRARTWQFPARIFRPAQGPPRLANADALEARVDKWLKLGGIPRTACGSWIFTWNAFRIECDPQSVLQTIELIDLGSIDLRDGASYRDKKALEATALKRMASDTGRASYVAEMALDGDTVRSERAASDVVIGEIMRKPISLDDATRARANEVVTGVITVRFDVDAGGSIVRRVTVTTVTVKRGNGVSETEVVTDTVERTPS